MDALTLQNDFAPGGRYFMNTTAPNIFFGGSGQAGKQLSLDTEVPTPYGFTTMGTIKIGDVVFAGDGSQTIVVGLSEIDLMPDAYELEFDTGEIVRCDADHLWVTLTLAERRQLRGRSDEFRVRRRETRSLRGTGKKPWLAEMNSLRRHEYKPTPLGVVRSTDEIRQNLLIGDETNHSVSICAAIDCEPGVFDVDPYMLGVWLGDGDSIGGTITANETDWESLQLPLESVGSIRRDKLRTSVLRVRIVGLTTRLRRLGLIQNKHIPTSYLRGSTEQRIQLLKGLMDTDGHCSKDGKCELGFSSLRLIQDAHELLSSLGIKAVVKSKTAMCNGKDCGLTYRINFVADFPVFQLARKGDRQKMRLPRSSARSRFIVDVRKIEPVAMRCIKVAHESGTYLIGRSMIMTHNSRGLRDAAVEMLLRYRHLNFPNRRVAFFADCDRTITENHLPEFIKEFGENIQILTTKQDGWHIRFSPGYWGEGMGVISLRTYAQSHRTNAKRGGQVDSVLADEITLCDPNQIGEMIYLLRNSEELPFSAFGCASNPDGISEEFIARMFVGPNLWTQDMDIDVVESRDYSDLDPWFEANRHTFMFIPAVREDNPAFEANKAEFDRGMAFVHDQAVRTARKEGKWGSNRRTRFGYVTKARQGFTWPDFLRAQGEIPSQFASENRRQAMHMIVNREVYGWELWASLDYGTAEGKGSIKLFHLLDTRKRVWTFGELFMPGKQLPEQARMMKPGLTELRCRTIFGSPDLKAKAPESRTGLTRQQQFAKEGIIITLAMNDRKEGWAAMDWLFDRMEDGSLPQHTVGFINYEECRVLWKQLLSLPRKEGDPEDVDKAKAAKQFGDDGPDAYRYGVFTRFKNLVGKEDKEAPEYGSYLWMEQERARELARSSLWY